MACFLQNYKLFEGIFSEFDFEVNAPQKKQKIKFSRYLKIIFFRDKQQSTPHLKINPFNTAVSPFVAKILNPSHYRPLQTLIPSYEGDEGGEQLPQRYHSYNTKKIVLNDRDSSFNTELINFYLKSFSTNVPLLYQLV